MSKWILVSDRLPKREGLYLAVEQCDGKRFIRILSFTDGKFISSEEYWRIYPDVVAWTTLPKEYSSEIEKR